MIAPNFCCFSHSVKLSLAKTSKIIFARFLDLVLSSLVPLVFSFTDKYFGIPMWGGWGLSAGITFLVLLVYFVVIPYYNQGQTIGKYLLSIKLISKTNSWKVFFFIAREGMIIFIPWMIALLVNMSLLLVFNRNLATLVANQTQNNIALLVLRLSFVFYLLWFSGLALAVTFDPHKQFFVDHYFQLFLVAKTEQPCTVPNHKIKERTKLISNHYHKMNMPGVWLHHEQDAHKPH